MRELILLCLVMFSSEFIVDEDSISNSILFPERTNFVLFVFSKNSTNLNGFTTLLNTFIEMEEQSYCLNNKTLGCPKTWLTEVQFGEAPSYTFENGKNLSEGFKNKEELFSEAQNVHNIFNMTSNFLWSKICIGSYLPCKFKCPVASTKEFYIIVTDVCLASVFENYKPAATACSKFYREFALLMPNNSARDCIIYNLFTPDKINEAKNVYSNMYVVYYVYPLSSTVNFFAVIHNNSFEMVSNLIKQKLTSETSTCRSGNLLGYFQIIDDYNDTMQIKYSIALPLFFHDDAIVNEWYFNENFNQLYSNHQNQIKYNQTCDEIKGFLLKFFTFKNATSQQIIFLSDQDPLCFEFKNPWNKTKIHFELIVSSSINSSSMVEYMKNIDFNNNKSNHIYFYNYETNNFSDYISSSSICSNFTVYKKWNILFTVPSSSTTSIFEPWTSSFSTTIKAPITHGSSNWWYIGPILIVMVLLIIILLFWYLKKLKQNKTQGVPKGIVKIMKNTLFDAQLSIEERQKHFIDKKMIYLDHAKILGKGSAALVFEGTYKTKLSIEDKLNMMPQMEDETCKVAIKVPSKFLSADDVVEFIRELDALIKIGSHPNTIKFYGWTLPNQIPSLIMELAPTDLLQFVRMLRGTEFSLNEILSILWQIAQALEHLASLSMIHRDVACRNILLTESGVAKLTDFGLCCHGDESFTYRASLQKRLPVKWLSIESLVDRIFSEKTDVWSFGILCYEVFSFGSDPYPSLANLEILTFLLNGKRMEKPESASDEIYDLMLKCWNEEASERPTFNDLNHSLRIMLESETRNYGYLTLDNLNFVE